MNGMNNAVVLRNLFQVWNSCALLCGDSNEESIDVRHCRNEIKRFDSYVGKRICPGRSIEGWRQSGGGSICWTGFPLPRQHRGAGIRWGQGYPMAKHVPSINNRQALGLPVGQMEDIMGDLRPIGCAWQVA